MKSVRAGLATLAFFATLLAHAEPVVLVIHGGAGAVSRERLSAEREAAQRVALEQALRAGYAVLQQDGVALDAVRAAIRVLEDSPLFNAGRGAVLNAAGRAELDASLMEGHTRRAGAVAAVTRVKNPIELAHAVMAHSPNVLMVGAGAERFAAERGLERVPPSYFITPDRRRELEQARRAQSTATSFEGSEPAARIGTVGAVALDRHGHLAAGTSTGGRTNKWVGRVGDAPIIGAGTYADARCAVSTTGWGEYFIRVGVARMVCARVALAGQSIAEAADKTLAEVAELGGDGGLIALDAEGRVAMPFNTAGMYRASISASGRITIAIYPDAPP